MPNPNNFDEASAATEDLFANEQLSLADVPPMKPRPPTRANRQEIRPQTRVNPQEIRLSRKAQLKWT